ncbi:MAG: hypothetical protein ACKVOR_14365, partial [Flavobacteriales bacterium]
FENNLVMFVLVSAVSALTAFYMFRLYFLTFHGKFRGTHDQEHHLHESPKTMTIPLIVLAVLSVVGGFIGMPHAVGEQMGMHWHWLDHFLEKAVVMPSLHMSVGTEVILMVVATAVAVASIFYAWKKYKRDGELALEDNEIENPTHLLLADKYRIDELYDRIIRKPIDSISAFFGKSIEPKVIDGLVNGTGSGTQNIAEKISVMQSGKISFYIAVTVIGLTLLLLFI